MNIHLRTYKTSDVPDLYLVDTLCFEPPFRFSREAIQRFAEARNAIVRVAVEPGESARPDRVAGFCIVHLEEAGAHLAGYVVTLDVHPEFRRQGIGPALMRSVETAAGDAGANAMVLHVWTGNEPAMRLYERLGYRYAQRADGFYGDDLDALVYRKSLTGEEHKPAEAGQGEWRPLEGSTRPAS